MVFFQGGAVRMVTKMVRFQGGAGVGKAESRPNIFPKKGGKSIFKKL
jgi:hypothetical protein